VRSLQQKRVHYAAVARGLRKTLFNAAVGPRVKQQRHDVVELRIQLKKRARARVSVLL
jgi:hypothetical protein